MLDFLGWDDQARRIEAAIAADMDRRAAAASQGDPLVRSTVQVGDDILAAMAQ